MSIGQQLPLSAISPSSTNPRKRFNAADLQELAESIKQHGVMQPILVRPTNSLEVAAGTAPYVEYEIVAGERRYRAAKLADLEYIPSIARELSDIETLQLQIIENLQRSDLHPMEEAQGFKALIDNKGANSWDADELAHKINKSRSYVYGALKLNDLCTYAQDMFLDGKFGREIALLIARIPGAKLQEQAAKDIIKGEYSYRAAKDYIRNNFTLDLNKAPWDKISITLYPAAGSCLSCTKRTGNYPELYPDIESPDVCTDTACFAAKKVAYAAEIIATNPRVIHGEEAKKVAPYGATHAYITNGFTANPEQVYSNGHHAGDIIGDEKPEPYVLVDEHHNITQLYKREEVETLMATKLQEKIDSGEIEPPQPKVDKEPQWLVDQRKRDANRIKEKEKRLHIVNRLIPHLGDDLVATLAFITNFVYNNYDIEMKPVLQAYNFEGDIEQFFIQFIPSVDEAIKLIGAMALSTHISPNGVWHSEDDNSADGDYQRLMAFISDIGLNQAEFLTAELPLTPISAAPADEISAEDGAGAETPAPEKAKRGRPAKKANQEESAKADA